MDGIQGVSHGQGASQANAAREVAPQEKKEVERPEATAQDEEQQTVALKQEEGQGNILDSLA